MVVAASTDLLTSINSSLSTIELHRDMLNFFGDGWEQRYASDVREYLYGLLHPLPMEAAK